MVYIEPANIHISTIGEQFSPSLEENYVEVPKWSVTHNWVFNKIIGDSYQIIDPEEIRQTLKSSINDLLHPIGDIDEEFADMVERQVMPLRARDVDQVILYQENWVVVPSPRNEGRFFVISEYESDVESIIDGFEGRINNFTDVAADFGIEINLQTGPDFAEAMSGRLNAEVVEREGFDNNMEESVYSEIADKLTKSIDSNVTLRFGKDDPEIFEYDLILYTSENHRVVVEVKDGSRDGADLDKSDLIDTPRDKSNIIEADSKGRRAWNRRRDKKRVFVVVKHMDSEKFAEQKRMAERRDIELLRYEDGDYLEKLENRFRNMTFMAI